MSAFLSSDARAVSRRILTLPRVAAVAAVVLLVSATIALAADKPAPMSKPASQAKAIIETRKKRAAWNPVCESRAWCRNVHCRFQQKLFVTATQNAPAAASRYGTPRRSSSQ